MGVAVFIYNKTMKSRPWILIVAIVVGIGVLLLYQGWNIFKANERIKNYLLARIRPVLGEQCDIQSLDIALGSVHLMGVRVESSNRFYSLWIDDLRIGYSITNLIRHGFQPQKSPQDILFVNPRITIHYIPKKERRSDTMSEFEFNRRYLEKARNFDFLKRITVSHGLIEYSDSLGVVTQLAQDISGWITTKDIQKAQARMVGKLFTSDRYNLRLHGEIDLVKSKLNFLEVNLANYRWEDKIPLLIPEYFNIKGGRVNANVLLSEKDDRSGFDIQGDVTIADGAFTVQREQLSVSDLQLDAVIRDWDILINNCSQIFNGSQVVIQGRIRNILDPVFDLTCESPAFDVGKFISQFNPGAQINVRGTAALNLTMRQSFRDPRVTMSVDCRLAFSVPTLS